MTHSELAKWCVDTGFLPRSLESQASQAIAQAYAKKGESETEEAVKARASRGRIYTMRVFEMALSDIPDKAPETPKAEEPKPLTIAEEIEIEKKDFYDLLECNEAVGRACGGEPRPFRRPNDPAFEGHPSIFDATPYREMDPETQALYKANTFLAVLDEAKNRGTSMHELCRQRGLKYELLLA